MDRPHAAGDRVVADAARRVAAARAARAAALTRRAAGARRRAALVAILLVAGVAGWAAVGLTEVGLLAGAAPTGLLAVVLGLGRQAVRAAQRADARWAADPLSALPAPRRAAVVGRAVHPSEETTQVIGRVPVVRRPVADRRVAEQAVEQAVEQAGEQRPEQRAAAEPRGARVDTWVPVAVPPPAYTLKPAVRREEPAPLALEQTVVEPAVASVPADQPVTTGGLSLDAILARRRASGQ